MLDALLDRTVVASFDRTGFARHARSFTDEPKRSLDTVLITGGTAGIGLAAAKGLSDLGADCLLWGRRASVGEAAAEEVGGRFASVDLSDLAAVRDAAWEVEGPLSAVVLNAGAMPLERTLTAQGHEVMWGSQVLGHLLLVRILHHRGLLTEDTRVLWVSSGGMYLQTLDLTDLTWENGYQRHTVYANAKRAQVMLGAHLARKWRDVTVGSMHPGWVETEAVRHSMPVFRFFTRPILRTPEQGADTIVWWVGTRRASPDRPVLVRPEPAAGARPRRHPEQRHGGIDRARLGRHRAVPGAAVIRLLPLLASLTASPAQAHGIWGHVHVTGWAVENMPDDDLRRFLLEDPEVFNALLFGAAFADTGYARDEAASRAYSEHTHWEPFVEDYIEWMRVNDPPPWNTLESKKRVAFLLGCASHGLQDSIFDSLFLHQVEDRDGAGQSETDPGTDGFLVIDDHVRFTPERDIPMATVLQLYETLSEDVTEDVIDDSVNLVVATYLNPEIGWPVARTFGEQYAPVMPGAATTTWTPTYRAACGPRSTRPCATSRPSGPACTGSSAPTTWRCSRTPRPRGGSGRARVAPSTAGSP